MSDLFADDDAPKENVAYIPTRAAGLARLDQFYRRMGRPYASTRNYDFGTDRRSNVSALSPWLRHRLITEEEVLRRALATHSLSTAEKFIQEVFWRGYFKGWLEQRPTVWSHYQKSLLALLGRLDQDPALDRNYQDAMHGRTGIDCFDHWAKELRSTGYLHNHARMWMASIWIFTLRLPWELGADFFLRHLLDGDPASNTLSWRWVGGLHTKGKTYLARPDNIAKYTQGRFQPCGLAPVAEPLIETVDHPRLPLSAPQVAACDPYILLVTEDDLSAAQVMQSRPVAEIGLLATHGRSPHPVADLVQSFAQSAMKDVLAGTPAKSDAQDDWAPILIEAAQNAGVSAIATTFAPVGPVRSRLDRAEPKLNAAGITLTRVMRPYDTLTWPHAKAGFFGLKKKIPEVLRQLGLQT